MEELNVKLDFFIIGAAKSGTTWLTSNLSKHPEIFIPEEKELGYFCEKNYLYPKQDNPLYLTNYKRFESYFANAKNEQLLGEGTTSYLWDLKAPENIFEHNKNAKLIAILRAPVERIISNYRYWLQLGIIPNKPISEIIQTRPEMLELGLYTSQLKRYFKYFPKNQIYILFFDDLINNNEQFLFSVEEFLGVNKFLPSGLSDSVNTSGQARFWWINRFIASTKTWIRNRGIDYDKISFYSKQIGLGSPFQRLMQLNRTKTKNDLEIDQATKSYLHTYYTEEITELESITKRDLSGWKLKKK